MSKTKLILTTGSGPEGRQIAFVLHKAVTDLPNRPGVFALLAADGTGGQRPIYFGFADRSIIDQLPYDVGFAQAIRQGPVRFATAYVPGGEEPETLVQALATAYDAPVNAKAAALADIEAAQSSIQALAQARKLAAQ